MNTPQTQAHPSCCRVTAPPTPSRWLILAPFGPQGFQHLSHTHTPLYGGTGTETAAWTDAPPARGSVGETPVSGHRHRAPVHLAKRKMDRSYANGQG
ncbi:hypothetical protein NHX12_011556 [Muraenolepis orangiensis]|uniref:Uncharacterized protein n=1 Tax=Muraenolepis orangiensis TaxID=630683 RepID=A0A9Q0DGL0_9TELE|nr:hypothetical protein NHX12_011556 [Muraenolepis orangiensis]